MPNNVSQRIVDFISGMPHYQHDQLDGKQVARRLTDGTILLAPDDPEDNEDGLIVAYWQGDSLRKSNYIIGSYIAGLEITEGIRIWTAMGQYDNYKDAYIHMANHFALKTGKTIHCRYDEDESVLLSFLGNAARTLGKDTLISIIKQSLGIP